MNNDFIKTDNPNLVKDRKTKAVINTDASGYARVLQERTRAKELTTLKADIETLKKQVAELTEYVKNIR